MRDVQANVAALASFAKTYADSDVDSDVEDFDTYLQEDEDRRATDARASSETVHDKDQLPGPRGGGSW